MLLLTLPYFLVALYLGGSAIWNGDIARGLGVIGASYLALGAGISLRKLFKGRFDDAFDTRKQAPLIAVLTALMLASSLALMHYFDITVGPIGGMVFSLIGAVIGCFSEMGPDADADNAEPSEG